jgi:predicted TIM-barrel fold metal-dependent hydrolase
MVFDAHMHVGDFGSFRVSLDRDGLAELMHANDVAVGIVFSPDNEAVVDVVDSIPTAYGLYWADPTREGHVEEARRFLDHAKFLGVKLHPLLDGYCPTDPVVYPLMEMLQERRAPVLVHTGHPIFTLPWSVEELAVAFPGVKVIMGHMGHGNGVYINAAIDAATRTPNVYLETSGMPMHTKIREAVERAGAHKVLYGSDVPFHHPQVEMLKVRLSGLSADLTERVLDSNARALFFGDEHAQEPLS